MKISWLEKSDRIKHELQQREEEGNNILELRTEWERIEKLGLNETELNSNAEYFYKKLGETPYRIQNEQQEPALWDDIERLCNSNKNRHYGMI